MPKNQKRISVIGLLSILPDKELNSIAKRSNVDYYVKVLDGKSVFYLILYALVECQRNSLRTMEDIFNSPSFKFLFNLDPDKTVKYNSISERLSVISIEFFKKAYELVYYYFSQYYSEQEIEGHNLVRVDSTMVAEASNKLKQGMNAGKKKDGKKQIKYTVGLNGGLPCISQIFTDKAYLSEDLTIPKVVKQYAKKDKASIFIFDRGVQKRELFCDFNDDGTSFVTRLKSNARYKTVKILEEGNNRKVGALELIQDLEINLGKPNSTKFIEGQPFRLIIAKKTNTDTIYFFLTNMFEPSVEQILLMYKKRWDIEVFFRFIKQELNFSHITSTSENGMQVMLYMTLITAMLVLIYKKLNDVGYKTAVRRISFELNEFLIKLVVKHCGGDPSLVFR